MKRTFLLPTATAVLAVLSLGTAAAAGETSEQSPQVIILKLDDVTNHGGCGDSPVSPRWQRVADFCEKSDVKASFGIIGFSLEQDDRAYFDWIRGLHRRGTIEFWNHGYRNRKATDKIGEFEGPFEEQKAALERTQRLAKEKLGIELNAFGPHWSYTNADTSRALEGIPEIRMWFYGPRDSRKFVFPRVLTLENPIFVPDPAKFRELYERVGRGKRCLALQGHPNAWDDKRWQGFVEIIDYLRSKGCVFMTPSRYMEEAASAPVVLARVLYGTNDDDAETNVEDWIAEAVAEAGSAKAVAYTGWMPLSPEQRELYSSMMGGRLLKGRATTKGDLFEVEISGMKIKPMQRRITLGLDSQRLMKLTDYPPPGNVFLALKVLAGRAERTQTSMKGWELYIWPQGGETHFSLLAGTNRLKTDEEIAQAAVKGIDAIKPKLDRLKAGQHVFLRGRRLSDRAPGDQAKAVAEYCAKIGLNVQP